MDDSDFLYLMMSCPVTGGSVWTGQLRGELKLIMEKRHGFTAGTVSRCRRCHQMHHWEIRDTWLQELLDSEVAPAG